MQNDNKAINICQIIKEESVDIYFQPVISTKMRSIVGLEALARGFCHSSGEMIMPNLLFRLAEEHNLTLELDRLCRKKALEKFRQVYSQNKEMLLFLNFDTSIIDLGVVGSGHLLDQVKHAGINPRNIVLEIIESKVNNVSELQRFINAHKELGFLFALDDIGCGYSNLDRIAFVKPDLIKADRALVKNINQDYYKQEVLKSLVNLSQKIGALVVAEGVEKEEETIMALKIGVDMLQGFYFAKPTSKTECSAELYTRIAEVSRNFKNHMIDQLHAKRQLHRIYDLLIKKFCDKLSELTIDEFDRLLHKVVNSQPNLECIYILNEAGIQVSDTFCNQDKLTGRQGFFFKPAPRGTDHSLKEYYYLLANTGLSKYTTEPYISLASGNLCITISTFFQSYDGKNYILCIDGYSPL
ncbi:EAL domain-containing protein [Desulfotruncus alcoholivorax]|uniref:EAL domain-containing protein n=1 Tax=Desulfotruncus alcoholivorax TaxID=265477 RepID=UPI00048932BA|nr:EAL domain-containing protein [Desulfotruncus alcoholivorax]